MSCAAPVTLLIRGVRGMKLMAGGACVCFNRFSAGRVVCTSPLRRPVLVGAPTWNLAARMAVMKNVPFTSVIRLNG